MTRSYSSAGDAANYGERQDRWERRRWLVVGSVVFVIVVLIGFWLRERHLRNVAEANASEARKQTGIATEEKERAERYAEDLKIKHDKASRAIQGIFDARKKLLGGASPEVEEALVDIASELDDVEKVDPWLGAIGHSRRGERLKSQSNEVDTSEVLREHEQAVALMERVVEKSPDDPYTRRGLSVERNKLGDVYLHQGDCGRALEQFERGHEEIKQAILKSGKPTVFQEDLAASLHRLGQVAAKRGKQKEAIENTTKGTDVVAASEEKAATPKGQVVLMVLVVDLGRLWAEEGNMSEAERCFKMAVDTGEKLSAVGIVNREQRRKLATAYEELGKVVRHHDLRTAYGYFEKTLVMRQKLAREGATRESKSELAVAEEWLARAALEALELNAIKTEGRVKVLDEARHNAEASWKLREELKGMGGLSGLTDLGISLEQMGDVRRAEGKEKEAANFYEQCVALRKRLGGEHPDNAKARENLMIAYVKKASVLRRDRPQQARREYENAAAVGEAMVKDGVASAESQRVLVVVYNKWGDALREAKEWAGARKQYEEAMKRIDVIVGETHEKNQLYMGDKVIGYGKMAHLAKDQEEYVSAAELWGKALEVLNKVEKGRTNIALQSVPRASAVLHEQGRCYALAARSVGEGGKELTEEQKSERGRDIGRAVDTLEMAVGKGLGIDVLKKDEDLAVLRENSRFRKLIEKTSDPQAEQGK